MMGEIEANLRAERKRRLAAEEAVDVALTIMRDKRASARVRVAVALWIFAGRAQLDFTEDRAGVGNSDDLAAEWDAAAASITFAE